MNFWRRYQSVLLIVTSLIALSVTIALYIIASWSLYAIWLVVVNLLTFSLFGIDKSLARAQSVRVPENVLHLYTLLGGVIGQALGRWVFHHKVVFRRHPMFTVVLIAGTLIHVLLIYLIFM